jgi:hypothetical protein
VIALGCHACLMAHFRVTRRTPSIEHEKSLLEFGRLPAALSGNVWALTCPTGEPVGGPVSARVAQAAARLLAEANGPRPRPLAVWRMMDPILHRLMGPRGIFVRALRTVHAVRVWSVWNLDVARPVRAVRKIVRQCGRDVARASWSINASFPRFEGDDKVNMIWVNERGGPRLWLLY